MEIGASIIGKPILCQLFFLYRFCKEVDVDFGEYDKEE